MGIFDFLKDTTTSNTKNISDAFFADNSGQSQSKQPAQEQATQPKSSVPASQPQQEEAPMKFTFVGNFSYDGYQAGSPQEALDKAKSAEANSDYKAMYSYYMIAALQNNPQGNLGVGKCYLEGKGTDAPKSAYSALPWFKKAVDAGCEEAYMYYADAKWLTQKSNEDILEVLHYYGKAQKLGISNRSHVCVKVLGALELCHLQELSAEENVFWGNLALEKWAYEKTALKCFEVAESQGSILARLKLGDLYYKGKAGVQNKEKAFSLYKCAAEAENAEGCYKYAKMLERGFGTERNIEQAMKWLDKAVALGHPYAAAYRVYIVETYELEISADASFDQLMELAEEFGNEYRYVQANKYYKNIADSTNNVTAMIRRGRILKDYRFPYVNLQEAATCFQKAAEMGNDAALRNLAQCYENGEGVIQSYEKALEYYNKISEKSEFDLKIIANLEELISGQTWNQLPSESCDGKYLYQQAELFKKDYKKQLALRCFEMAAEQGNSSAMIDVGKMYLNGEGCLSNYEKAFYWLNKGKENKYYNINFELGVMYGYGHYTETNLEKAEEFLLEKATFYTRFLMLDAIKEYHELFANSDNKYAKHVSEVLTVIPDTIEEDDEEYEDIVIAEIRQEDQFVFENPISNDDVCDTRVLTERAKEGDSGAMLMLANYYVDGMLLERNIDEALYWLYKVVNSSTAPEQNVLFAARKLGQWYTIGVNVNVDYERALFFYEKLEKLNFADAVNTIEELKEVISIQKKPDSYMYMDEENLRDVAADAIEAEKYILTMFYCRELIRRDSGIGYYMYGNMIEENPPLGYIDNDHELARACYYKATELGCEYSEVALAYTYVGPEGFVGEPAQIRQWLERAIKNGREDAQEAYDELYAYYEAENLLDDWNEDEPLKEVTFPDWFLLGIESRGENEKAPARELPDNLDHYFEGFIGMNRVKEQLQKIYQSVKLQIRRDEVLRQRGEEPAQNEKGYNFILLGNPGTGKTSVARIIAKILYDINIRETDTVIEVERSRLIGDHIGSTETRMRSVLDKVKGGTLFIDEAYALYKEDNDNDFGQEAIDVLMKDMEDNRNYYSVIMAGYKQPMLNMIKNANSGFSSRFTYQIEIPDYTEDELIEMAHCQIEKLKYEITDKVDDAIRKCIRHDKIDDTFGNARYIRELVNRAIENQSARLSESGMLGDDDIFLLTAEDFWLEDSEEETVEKYLKELDGMIGLDSVKEEVKSLINRITVMKEMEKRGLGLSGDYGTLHMTFKGNPGTGKTTVARLLGKIYAALGVLKRGDVFVECNRSTLVGKYQGHTAANVTKTVQSALGGILFIDEAYSLMQGEGDSFGQEAVDTLVAEMENHRQNLVVILAGYSQDIEKFLETNQGLKSRVPIDIVFEDYNQNDMNMIARKMISDKKLTLSEDASDALKDAILIHSAQEDFGNARGIRNMVDGFIRRQNVRIAGLLREDPTLVTDEILTTLTKDDIQ